MTPARREGRGKAEVDTGRTTWTYRGIDLSTPNPMDYHTWERLKRYVLEVLPVSVYDELRAVKSRGKGKK